MAEATYKKQGDMLDYTPGTAVAAGEVIVQGALVGIAGRDIAAGELDALALTGIFDVFKLSTDAVTVGQVLYWDAGNNRATTTASTHKRLGLATAASASGQTQVLCKLNA